MIRTYKSKKDSTNVVERRDLFQNLDGKSAVYDAFSIQNIKQTKRELSCIGNSNTLGITSNKVRKKKYVKRIVKEIGTPRRESMSLSTYLTPDKSIHVNKPLDPFDLLLMSSPARSPAQETVESRPNEANIQLEHKKQVKTYTRKRPKRVKKKNFSSTGSSDSDKENSDDRPNITHNTSDIRSHKLLVEQEENITPKKIDDSIYNIVNNLSVLHKLKYKYSANDSVNNSIRKDKHRLTRNMHSPLLSPLCSTPFKMKYRGDSIFKFSPILATNKYNNQKHRNIALDNVNAVSSQLNSDKVNLFQENPEPSPNFNCDYEHEISTNRPHVEENVENVPASCEMDNVSKIQEASVHGDTDKTSSKEKTFLQTTETEPFLGFSQTPPPRLKENLTNMRNCETNTNAIELDEKNKHHITKNIIENYQNENTIHDPNVAEIVFSVNYKSTEEKYQNNNPINDPNATEIEVSDNDQSMEQKYRNSDPIHSRNTTDIDINKNDRSTEEKNQNNNTIPETYIAVSRREQCFIEDNVMLPVHNMKNIYESSKCSESNKTNVNNNTNTDEDSDTSLHSAVNNSLYDTCNSEQSFIEENEVIKEPIVVLQRMNDSSFFKYYKNKNSSCYSIGIDENSDSSENAVSEFGSLRGNNSSNENSNCNLTIDEENEFEHENNANDCEEDDIFEHEDNTNDCKEGDIFNHESNTNNCEKDDISEYAYNIDDCQEGDMFNHKSNTNNYEKDDIFEHEGSTCNCHDDISSIDNEDSISSNDEDKYVSFVTTRRRKTDNNTRSSMISVFNDSYCSSSTDCDKTVLSNNKKFNNSDVSENVKDKIDTVIIDIDVNSKCNEATDDIRDRSIVGLNKDSEDEPLIEPRVSFVTVRNSYIKDRKNSIKASKHSIKPKKNTELTENFELLEDKRPDVSISSCLSARPSIVLRPGKKWERSLSIYKRMTMTADHFNQSILDEDVTESKGRKYRQSVISTIEMQDLNCSLHNESINSRRSTFVSKPSRSTIRIVKDPNITSLSLCDTTLIDDIKGFWNEECDDTIIELSKLSIADHSHEVTVLDNFHDTSNRIASARDYVLRRCNQTDSIPFDECYPDATLKNCHKIGEGVYGEVFLWRGRDGRARVLKIVPIAGNIKVNGENQKDFHEIISEIVIAMELSALRAPIAEIERHLDEGKDVEALDLHEIENATDVFNEVLAVRCVYGSYPSRLLDLWDLYDECKGSENDNPAILPPDQQYIVLELANAGQDLESYQFNNAEQAHALFLQVAYGLAVAEEAFQFEHRDLHWGNVLISPTDKKYATFVIRGRALRVPCCGVRGAIIDYSLSRVALRLPGGEAAALYNDLAGDDSLFDAVGDYQFEVYRLMREKLRNDWKNFEPYTNILWLHYTVDKMITALRYKKTNTKIHKHYIDKLKGIKSRILDYGSAAQFVLTDNEI